MKLIINELKPVHYYFILFIYVQQMLFIFLSMTQNRKLKCKYIKKNI